MKPKTKNIKPLVEEKINAFLDKFKTKKEILGIVLLGGLGKKNFLDDYSDIDIAVFVDGKIPKFLPSFEFEVEYKGKELLFNVHQQNIKEEKKKVWSEGKKNAYKNGLIYFEKGRIVSNLFKEKLKFDEKEALNKIIKIAGQFPWYVNINPERALKRGFPFVAQDLLNQGADFCIEVLYILNKKFLPHKKWRIANARSLNYVPKNFEKELKNAMMIKGFDLKDIRRREKSLNKLMKHILEKTKKIYSNFPKDPYKYACENLYGRQLLKKTFADKFIETHKFKNEKTRNRMHGLLNFNLISNNKEAQDILKKLKNNKDKKTILIADSCAGGLSVLKEIIPWAGDSNIFYLADYKKNPFGLKTKKEIQKIVESWLQYFTNKYDIDLLIIACNTASVAVQDAISKFSKKYKIPIITMLKAVEDCVKKNKKFLKNKITGIMGTKFIVNSKKYLDLIKKQKPKKIIPIIATKTEQAVAQGFFSSKKGKKQIFDELNKYVKNDIDTILLGCTCFPFVKDQINAIFGKKIVFFDPAKQISENACILMEIKNKKKVQKIHFFVTGDIGQGSKKLNSLSKILFKKKVDVSGIDF